MIRVLILAVMAGSLAGCQEPYKYTVDPREAAQLPRDRAAAFLSLASGGTYGDLRPDHEHCEFSAAGLRIAKGNPDYAKTVVDRNEATLRRIPGDRQTLAAEQRKLSEDQRSVETWLKARGRPSLAEEQRKFADDQRDFEHWLQVRGKPNVAAEKRKLEEDHVSAERWLRLRGMPADQIERARAEIAKEKQEFEPRYASALSAFESEKRDIASRPAQIAAAMEQERNALNGRGANLQRDEDNARNAIRDARARVHDPVPYRNAGFAISQTEFIITTYKVDIDYRVPANNRTDSCGFTLVSSRGATPGFMQQLVNALAALGIEPQQGLEARPPLR